MKDIIKQDMIKRLSKKDYCSFSLNKCLIKKYGFKNKDIIDSLIKEYQDKKIINDEEYKVYIINKYLKTYHGLLYILYKLKELGYKDLNLDAYKEEENKYKEKYLKLISKYPKNKIINRLLSRGYSIGGNNYD